MKCSMLIAEDHALTAQYLANNIDWESLDIEVIGVASNGKEALSIIEKKPPDILLTDIRMPIMDGLQLIRRLNKNRQKVKPVILTAYDEFSYAQEAIRCGAVDYVLKPIEDEVLKKTIRQVQRKITREKKEKKRYAFLLEKMRDRFPVLRNDFFFKLLKGTYNEKIRLDETVSFLGLGFSTYHFCVLATVIDRSEVTCCIDRKQLVNLTSDLIDSIETTIQKDYCLYPVSLEEITAFIICCKKQGSNMEIDSIAELCKRAQELFHEKTEATFSAGLSLAHYGLTQLFACYTEAKTAVGHKFLSGPSQVFIFSRSEAEATAIVGTEAADREDMKAGSKTGSASPDTAGGKQAGALSASGRQSKSGSIGTGLSSDGLTGAPAICEESPGNESAAASFIYPFKEEQQLTTYVSIGKQEEALRELERFFSFFETKRDLSDVYIKEAVITMIMRAANTVRQELESTSFDTSVLSPQKIVALSAIDSLGELQKECKLLIHSLCDLVRQTHSYSSHPVVERAMSYIFLHYQEDFTIDDVASFVGYSPNYFSHVFKKYMQKSFSRVLTGYRINQAKRLLRKPYLRISEIAERVGYHDPQYFSQIFGINTGMNPSEYRKDQESSNSHFNESKFNELK